MSGHNWDGNYDASEKTVVICGVVNLHRLHPRSTNKVRKIFL